MLLSIAKFTVDTLLMVAVLYAMSHGYFSVAFVLFMFHGIQSYFQGLFTAYLMDKK